MTLPERLPGELYNADDQCSRAFGDKSITCPAPFLKEVSRYSLSNELNNNNNNDNNHHHLDWHLPILHEKKASGQTDSVHGGVA